MIHAVGPRWRGGEQGEPEALASCYRRSLELAVQHGLRSVAFPAISCGIYGYPLDLAAAIAVKETRSFLNSHPELEKVFLACFDAEVLRAYRQALESLAPGTHA